MAAPSGVMHARSFGSVDSAAAITRLLGCPRSTLAHPSVGQRLVFADGITSVELRLVSGLAIRYRHSPAVSGDGPLRGPRPGQRLLDAPVRAGGVKQRLHASVRPPGIHVLCCGDGPWDEDRPAAITRRWERRVQIHRLKRPNPSQPLVGVEPGRLADVGQVAPRRLGVDDNAVLVVRPDGYVGARSSGTSIDATQRYLARWLFA